MIKFFLASLLTCTSIFSMNPDLEEWKKLKDPHNQQKLPIERTFDSCITEENLIKNGAWPYDRPFKGPKDFYCFNLHPSKEKNSEEKNIAFYNPSDHSVTYGSQKQYFQKNQHVMKDGSVVNDNLPGRQWFSNDLSLKQNPYPSPYPMFAHEQFEGRFDDIMAFADYYPGILKRIYTYYLDNTVVYKNEQALLEFF